jgi:hypothetical protein
MKMGIILSCLRRESLSLGAVGMDAKRHRYSLPELSAAAGRSSHDGIEYDAVS